MLFAGSQMHLCLEDTRRKGEVMCIAKILPSLGGKCSQSWSRHLSPISENSDLEGTETQVWGILHTVDEAQTIYFNFTGP